VPPNAGSVIVAERDNGDAVVVGQLSVVVEVRTKLFASRLDDKQRRADLISNRLAGFGLSQIGVWLILAEGSWSQA
jgi:hypothetical protein